MILQYILLVYVWIRRFLQFIIEASLDIREYRLIPHRRSKWRLLVMNCVALKGTSTFDGYHHQSSLTFINRTWMRNTHSIIVDTYFSHGFVRKWAQKLWIRMNFHKQYQRRMIWDSLSSYHTFIHTLHSWSGSECGFHFHYIYTFHYLRLHLYVP